MDAVVEGLVKLGAAVVVLLAVLYWIVNPERGEPT